MKAEQPFFSKYTFLADFIGTHSVRNVEVTITIGYSEKPKIIGYVSCNPNLGSEIELLQFDRDLILRSSVPDAAGCEFESDHFSFGTVSHYKISETRVKTNIEINFDEIRITKTYQEPPIDSTKEIFFYLSTPDNAWPLIELRHHDPFGKVSSELRNSIFDIGIEGIQAELKPRYFYDRSGNKELSVRAYVIQYKTQKKDISVVDFTEQMIRITNDIMLLISFNSKRASSWFKYESFGGGKRIEYFTTTHDVSQRPLHIADLIIEQRHIYEFIKCGLMHLSYYRDNNIDIVTPIWYYITAMEYRYINEKFPILFLGIEKLKDQYAKSKSLLSIVDENRFSDLCRRVKKHIKETFPNEKEIRRKIYSKLLELNRPSMLNILDEMLNDYNISRVDLYPPKSEFTLIKTRDKLFHSSEDVNTDLFFLEYERLEALLERICLRLLGWRDFSRSPQKVILKRLNQQ